MLKRCSMHPHRANGPVATMYYRWLLATETWVGYRMYLCVEDAQAEIARMGRYGTPLLASDTEPTCVVCGAEIETDDCCVYGWFYPPHREPVVFEIGLCHEDLDKWVEPIRSAGTVLSDRDQSARASAFDPWAALIPAR